MKTLEGKVVAITGAAGGIGRALAFAALGRGARVALADLNGEALEALRAELSAHGTPESHLFLTQLDVGDRARVFEWSRSCEARFGGVDALINNAGVNLHVPIEEMDPSDLAWLLGVNFWGAFHGVQAFLPLLVASGDGHIVNLSSAFGLVASPGSAAYVTSKFALRGFTEALEIELALAKRPVGVTCVHPGGVHTGIVRNGRTRGQGTLSRSHEVVTAEFEKQLARMTPERCADQILRAILSPKPRLVLGLDAHLLDWFSRIFPGKYRRILAWALGKLGHAK